MDSVLACLMGLACNTNIQYMLQPSHLELLLGSSPEKHLQALLQSKLLLKQLTCQQQLQKSMWVIQRTTILQDGIQSNIQLLKTEPGSHSDDHSKKKRKKKKKAKAPEQSTDRFAQQTQSQTHDTSELFELLCRSIYNKEETLEGLRVHVEAFIVSTPDEFRFIETVNTVMNNYIKDTCNFIEIEMRPKLLTEAGKSQRLCLFMLTRLQEYFEGITDSCEQIESIISRYFLRYKKTLSNYLQYSEYLASALGKLVLYRIMDNCPQLKDFIIQSAKVEGVSSSTSDSFNDLQEILDDYHNWCKTKKQKSTGKCQAKTQLQEQNDVLTQMADAKVQKYRLQCEFDTAWLKNIENSFQTKTTSKRKK